jgi:hypothetical protein
MRASYGRRSDRPQKGTEHADHPLGCVPRDVDRLGASGDPLDTEMIEDLRRMISRSEHELEALTGKLAAARSS